MLNIVSFPRLAALISFVVISGLANAAEPGVIARVGDQDVQADAIRPFLETLNVSDQAALTGNPTLLNEYVRTLILQQIVLKEALAEGWDKKPEAAGQLERVRQAAIAQAYLDEKAAAPADYPNDEEIQAAYEANKAALIIPRQSRLAQVYIAAPKDSDKTTLDKAKAKAEAVRNSLGQPKVDFAAIARTQSDEKESAARGGEIGWMTEAQLQPAIRAAVADLGKDAIADPVQLDDGWHIIKVLDVKEAYTASLEQSRELLARQLRAARAKANREAYVRQLMEKNPVSVNEIAVSQLLEKKQN